MDRSRARLAAGPLVAALGLALLPAGDLEPSDPAREAAPIVPARAIALELERAALEGPLDAGHRLLAELATRTGIPRPGPLRLTPETTGRLVRAGLGGFLRPWLRPSTAALSSGTGVLQLQAQRDGTLYETVDGSLANGAGEFMFAGMSGPMAGNSRRRAVLAFDVASQIPPGATILAATLDVNVSRANGGSQTLSLHRLTADWGEGPSNAGSPGGTGAPSQSGDATWLHAFYPSTLWSSPGGDFSPTVSASTVVDLPNAYGFSSAQLAADVQDMLDNPGSDFGWIVLGNESVSNTAKRIDTRENAVPSLRPVLTVTVSGVDLTPPAVSWTAPGPGTALTPEVLTSLEWTASDPSGVAFIDLFASYDGGTTFAPVALGLAGTATQYDWFPPNRPGPTVLRIRATDTALNTGDTDLAVTISSVFDSILPTTLRDYDQPGTQPLEHGLNIRDPSECAICHADYDTTAEPYFGWSGSMMANAARDPLFEACLTIAEQDANGSGDLCLRCHIPKAWTEGRSVPTDGSQVQSADRVGIACDHCHRLVDPLYDPLENPPEDAGILAGLSTPPSGFGTGQYVLDPSGTRRGPFADAICDQVAHPFLTSPFHTDSALCGTCHDVSNPAWEADGMGNFVQLFDQAAAGFDPHEIVPVERTYSEWKHSAYNTPGGVYNPTMGGNREYVSSCMDCHMRAVDGVGCNPLFFPGAPVRSDLPQHDLTGGNTWVPTLIDQLYPGEVDPAALTAVVQRARFMLQNAATLDAQYQSGELHVRIVNETGHKLPTGYPDGRRMWLNVQFYDSAGNLVKESGAYDLNTGILTHDAELKLYEMKAGLDANAAAATGLPQGPSFHFVLNNEICFDNRIPPRGFSNADFASFGGQPVGYSYADGQYWDDTTYSVPSGARRAVITLYYQTTSKEYVEFLRDENTTDNKGQVLYDLWDQNGKCPPEEMERATVWLYETDPQPVPGAAPGPGRGITK